VDFTTASPTRITIRRELKLNQLRPSKHPQDLIFALEDGKKPEAPLHTIIGPIPEVRKDS
jgi:hypothetical protein